MCKPTDRACREDARARSLEIACETSTGDYVYCPAQGYGQDNPVLWILLAAAFVIAIVGMSIAWFVMRSSKTER